MTLHLRKDGLVPVSKPVSTIAWAVVVNLHRRTLMSPRTPVLFLLLPDLVTNNATEVKVNHSLKDIQVSFSVIHNIARKHDFLDLYFNCYVPSVCLHVVHQHTSWHYCSSWYQLYWRPVLHASIDLPVLIQGTKTVRLCHSVWAPSQAVHHLLRIFSVINGRNALKAVCN